MADYNQAYSLTSLKEGGWVDDKTDRGGETYAGITRKNFPNWPGWVIIDSTKKYTSFPGILKESTALAAMVKDFYKIELWNRLLLNQVNSQHIAFIVFDLAVHSGPELSVEYLQRVLNVTNDDQRRYPDMAVDGKMGPNTLRILNSHERPEIVLKCMVSLRGAKMIGIAEKNKSQERYINGWIERAFEQFEIVS